MKITVCEYCKEGWEQFEDGTGHCVRYCYRWDLDDKGNPIAIIGSCSHNSSSHDLFIEKYQKKYKNIWS